MLVTAVSFSAFCVRGKEKNEDDGFGGHGQGAALGFSSVGCGGLTEGRWCC